MVDSKQEWLENMKILYVFKENHFKFKLVSPFLGDSHMTLFDGGSISGMC